MVLSKRVAKTNTPWTEGRDGSVIVDAGESYSYQLRLGPPQGTMAKDIIFYDALENYQPGTGDVQWRGILTGIDLSQPEYKGADPIVYYSTSDVFKNSSALDLETNRDLTNSELWSTYKPGDASQITAIAIDLSKNNDGEPFILSDKETLSIILHMKAPDDIAQSAIANAKTFIMCIYPIQISTIIPAKLIMLFMPATHRWDSGFNRNHRNKDLG